MVSVVVVLLTVASIDGDSATVADLLVVTTRCVCGRSGGGFCGCAPIMTIINVSSRERLFIFGVAAHITHTAW